MDHEINYEKYPIISIQSMSVIRMPRERNKDSKQKQEQEQNYKFQRRKQSLPALDTAVLSNDIINHHFILTKTSGDWNIDLVVKVNTLWDDYSWV